MSKDETQTHYVNNTELYEKYIEFNNQYKSRYKMLHKLFDTRSLLKDALEHENNEKKRKEIKRKLNKITLLVRSNIPQLPDEIVLLGYKICEKYVKTSKWYSHKYIHDELISAGIIEIITYGARFDIRLESKNPFSYLTALCNNAFIRHLNSIKKYNQNKHGTMRNNILNMMELLPDGQIFAAIDTLEGQTVLNYMDEIDKGIEDDSK